MRRVVALLTLMVLIAAAQASGQASSDHAAPDQTTRDGSPPPPSPGFTVLLPASSPHMPLEFGLLSPVASAAALRLAVTPWDGGDAAFDGADLALVDGGTLDRLCGAGTIRKLDWQGLGRGRYLDGTTTECGAGAFVSTLVLGWDRTRFDGTPAWPDFWDVTKHPGKRALPRSARFSLEIALLADGVAPGDVYRTLRATGGVDRAFRKLDQLKPYLVWWDGKQPAAKLLSSGDVLMAAAPADRLLAGAGAHPVGLQWAGSLRETSYWTVPTSAPHAEVALAAIAAAADPVRQATLFHASGLSPTTTLALALLPPDARAGAASDTDHIAAGIAVDEAFWRDNREALDKRFGEWLAK